MGKFRFVKMRAITSAVALFVCLSLILSACGSAKPKVESEPEPKKASEEAPTDSREPLKLTFMTMYFGAEPINMDSPIIHELEKRTNTQVNYQQIPVATLSDKVNTMIAANNIPELIRVVSFRDTSIINAVRAGMFWEVGPFLKDYPNLNRIIKEEYKPSISYDGKLFGLPNLAIAVNNSPLFYRKDWADKLGLAAPKTVDDLYQMAKLFTENDPDGNEKNDTFGLANYDVTHIMSWFGAPNGWSVTNGEFAPSFEAPDFMDGLKFYKKLYDEKMVPQDFAMMNQSQAWDLINKGKAGILLGAIPQFVNPSINPKKLDPNAELGFVPNLEGPRGKYTFAANPAGAMLFISKTSVKTETDLRRILQFLDDVNREENVRLITFGLENIHYEIQDGKIVPTEASKEPNALIKNIGLFQLENGNIIRFKYTPGKTYEQLYTAAIDNSAQVVYNPAEPFTPKTKMDPNFAGDLQKKFILGSLNEESYKAEIAKWRNDEGNEYIKELEEEYSKSRS